MSKGWHRQPRAHALAAKGISTRQRVLPACGLVQDIVEYSSSVNINYGMPEEMFTLFWASSLSGDWSNFDFDQAFDVAEERIREKLASHGMLGPSSYRAWLEELYPWPMAIDDFEASSGMLLWGVSGVRERIRDVCYGRPECEEVAGWEGDIPLPDDVSADLAEMQAEEWRYQLQDNVDYGNLLRTYGRLHERPVGLRDQIVLMDEIVHAQHIGGSIWDDVDVAYLRRRVEAVSRSVSRRRGEF